MPNNDTISRSDFGLTILKLAMPTLYSGTVKVDDVLDALEKAPAVSEMTTLVTLSDGYGHVREAYYDEVRQLVFTECISVKDLDSRYINITERKELSDNEDSQL